MFHFMTAVTRAAMQGKTAERDMTDKRKLSPRKKNRANNTATPRTRDGATHPGGKHRRRALKTLDARVRAFVAKPDRTKPGSMQG